MPSSGSQPCCHWPQKKPELRLAASARRREKHLNGSFLASTLDLAAGAPLGKRPRHFLAPWQATARHAETDLGCACALFAEGSFLAPGDKCPS